jgi:6-pyruvoyltetrahydropterin/6-carboxytetrahydropterin synthase
VNASFSVYIAKEHIKFSAAHFVARTDYRGSLHGHNYTVAFHLEGAIRPHGYVIDFGVVKELAKRLVDEFNERTLIPTLSPCLTIQSSDQATVRILWREDEFILPRKDLCLLPITHSTVEELARIISERLQKALSDQGELDGITALEVTVAEAPGEAATFRQEF